MIVKGATGYLLFVLWFQMFSVENNVIDEISHDAFFGLKKLAFLKIKQSKLCEMPPLDTVKDTIQVLILYGNRITFTPQDYFEGFLVLRELILSQNRLIIFPEVHPVRKTLQMLRISHNNITSISSSIVDNVYPYLTEICLNGNKMVKIPTDVLSAWPNIRYFDIEGNQLSKLDEDVFGGFNGSYYVQINLFLNPWRCDSALAWFTELSTGKKHWKPWFRAPIWHIRSCALSVLHNHTMRRTWSLLRKNDQLSWYVHGHESKHQHIIGHIWARLDKLRALISLWESTYWSNEIGYISSPFRISNSWINA